MIRRTLGVIVLCALLGTAAFGLAEALKYYPQAVDTAASVLSYRTDRENNGGSGEIFVSLGDIIAASLSRLGDIASSSLGREIEPEVQSPAIMLDEPVAESGNLSDAIVNIYCTQTTREYRRSVSGTGFFISDRGVILTNAHVAQFLLLQNAPDLGQVECAAATGTDGGQEFSLALLYISPSWLIKHASMIDSSTPRGTGENDFALLYVNGTTDSSTLPARFSYLPPATNAMSKDAQGNTVILVGYPSHNDSAADRVIATTTITHLYTFGGGYADIFTLDSSPLGHQGASGGPVIDHLGRAIGVIATKDEGTTILNAITVAHIDRSIKSETGFDLASYIQGDLNYKARLFNETVSPILQELLAGYLR